MTTACSTATVATQPDAEVVMQPDASALVDDTREPYQVWRRREPIYELYIRHFSPEGTFKAVEARLDELKALGIGIVWLLPVHEIGSKAQIDAPHGNPYAVKSYERLNPEYGTEQDLVDLVAAAHQRGMSVILDWVPNHTAWDSELMSTHPDWYARDGAGNVRPVSDEFSWIAQLDWTKPGLRTYMMNVMVDWVRKFDLDGFRIDFAHSIPMDWFRALRPALERVKPVFMLAEAGDIQFHDAFDMTYDWNVYPVFGEVAHGWKPASAIDDPLLHTQLVPYTQRPNALVMRMTYNHDDNGKWTLGDRYRGGIRTFAVVATLLPGKPLVWEGQEVGDSKSLGHDPAIKTDWTDPNGYRAFYTKLLQLFRANSALHQPGMDDFRKLHTTHGDRVYSFIRRDGPNTVIVVANLSEHDVPSVVLQPQPNAGSVDGVYTELFTEQQVTLHAGTSVHLGPWAYRVYVQGPLR